jgi:nitroimidazol reductase NimA-like FMN-containing flavoprotein (pyridoxamine 5'-phosphate oxidase superfamily)
MDPEIPPTALERLAGTTTVAHLATSVEDRPHCAPLWYRYEGGTVEILTTGRKLANIRENPRVALSIQEDVDGLPEWEVILLGTATVIEDQAATRAANRRLNEKYGVGEDSWEENTLVEIDVGSASYREW